MVWFERILMPVSFVPAVPIGAVLSMESLPIAGLAAVAPSETPLRVGNGDRLRLPIAAIDEHLEPVEIRLGSLVPRPMPLILCESIPFE